MLKYNCRFFINPGASFWFNFISLRVDVVEREGLCFQLHFFFCFFCILPLSPMPLLIYPHPYSWVIVPVPFPQRTFSVPLFPYTRPPSLLYALVNVLLNYFPCSLALVLFPICPFSLYPFVFSHALLNFRPFLSSPVPLPLILRY